MGYHLHFIPVECPLYARQSILIVGLRLLQLSDPEDRVQQTEREAVPHGSPTED